MDPIPFIIRTFLKKISQRYQRSRSKDKRVRCIINHKYKTVQRGQGKEENNVFYNSRALVAQSEWTRAEN